MESPCRIRLRRFSLSLKEGLDLAPSRVLFEESFLVMRDPLGIS